MIRSNVREITAVWSPAIGYIQELETLTAKVQDQTVSASGGNRRIGHI